MMTSLALNPILAAQGELIRVVVLAVIMLGGAILKKITDAREQAERERARLAKQAQASKTAAGPPRRDAEFRAPDAAWTGGQEGKAGPRRDNPHRNEIEQFLEEVGRRRSPGNPAQRGEPVSPGAPPNRPMVRPPLPAPVPIQRNPGQPGRARPEGPKSPPPAAAQTPPSRPGSEMAMRKAPGTEDLGNQVRTHANQYLDSSRMSQRVQADLGSAVERTVREHLGTPETSGPRDKEKVTLVAGVPILTLLRSPAGVRTAILVNEILERPKWLRRKS
jgi:hypothetical protein